MTDLELRDLFHSAATDPVGHDPLAVERAWRDGTRRRMGTRAAVVGTIAVTAAAVTGVALVDGSTGWVAPPVGSRSSSPTSTPTSTETGPSVAEPAGDYAGAHVWWAPSVMDEAGLPPLSDAPVPPVIDIGAAEVDDVGEAVLALFSGRGERAFVLTASQRVVELDTSELDPVSDEWGNGRSPVSSYSLSSDRRRAFFIQNSSLEVLDFVTGEWTSIDTPDWLAEGARWVMSDEIWVPESLDEDSSGTVHQLDGGTSGGHIDWVQGWTGPDDEPWGPVAVFADNTAQAAFTGMLVPGGMSYPQGLMVDQAGARFVLALEYGGPGGGGTRGKGCCVALGWLDRETVLFSSSGTEGQRILAWRVGTERVFLVSEILGRASITALADLT